MPLSFAGSKGKGFGWCFPEKARAIGVAVAACSSVVAFTSSAPTRLVSAAAAPPAAMIVIARLLETVFIFVNPFAKVVCPGRASADGQRHQRADLFLMLA